MDSDELERTLEAALAGDRVARNRLVDLLIPLVQKCVARALLRHSAARGRAIRQDVEDLTQDVLIHLISNDFKVLRAWNPKGGMSLKNWICLIATRRTNLALRSRKKSPYTEDPTPDENFDRSDPSPLPDLAAISVDLLRKLLVRLKEEVSELGYYMFTLLFMCELPPEEVAKLSGKSIASVYKWQERLRKIVRRLLDELSKSPPPGQST